MKSIKTYLIVMVCLLIAALVALVSVWYVFQKTQNSIGDPTPVLEKKSKTNSPQSTTTEKVTTTKQKPIVIQTESLSSSQQKTLETLGYSKETITISPEMIACAEDAVGKDRLTEITNGAAPTPIEAVKLLPCFNK